MFTSLSRARRVFVATLAAFAVLSGLVVAAQPAAADVAPSSATVLTIRNAVFATLNNERAVNGRPVVHMNTYLVRAAHAHNLKMAQYNTMSHQLPGELSLGSRITSAGYTPWVALAENVAWNSAWTQAGALQLEYMMYNEVAPNNGHRVNILNSTYTDIGIDIYIDTVHHKLWLTEDFGRP